MEEYNIESKFYSGKKKLERYGLYLKKKRPKIWSLSPAIYKLVFLEVKCTLRNVLCITQVVVNVGLQSFCKNIRPLYRGHS